ncbi:hypothetical protein [Chryseobacterium sp.]|uniref:hypothetical protein n=1 Tax=Chryseobacterium sp. TaxID=1871047 RepID=UPI0025C32320|nr:hypothetical protein [Chryseobacterium sp.]
MKKIILLTGIFYFTSFYSQKNQNYVQIGYASICCGTPSESPVINYVKQFQKKNKLQNPEMYIEPGLGKEGEFSLYIGIDNLSKNQKDTFTKGLQSVISSQNNMRKKNRDGFVNFDETNIAIKEDLLNKKLTIYKNK